MPIVNLTKSSEVGSGLPRIAKLHKGEKKTEANRPGKDLDYFRVEFEPEFAHLRDDWEELYGDKPEGFEQVFMTYGTVDEAFASWKEEWNSSATMLHRCDGEHQAVWYSQAAQAYSTSKEKCAAVGPNPCACKNVGRLNLLIPEFIQSTGILGYVMVETHSINDILTVYRTLADVQRINTTLLGVPFSLGRATKKISAPKMERGGNKNGRIKVNKSLFYLHVDPDFTRETLLPRLASSGGFLSAHQPQLAVPELPKLEVGTARGLLNSGAGQRRLGATEIPFELPPQPYDEDAPEEVEVKPTEPEPTPAPVVKAELVAQPKPTPQQTIVEVKTVGTHLGEVKTRALKEIFNNKIVDMNHCVSELMQAGKLPPALTIEKALEVIKAANYQPAPESIISQQMFDDLPSEKSAALKNQFEPA